MKNKKIFIRDFVEGQNISDVFVIVQAQRKDAKNGPYWQLTLADRTGEIEARVWYPLSLRFDSLRPEQFVEISAQAALFKDQMQLTISALTPCAADEVDASEFLPSSSTPAPMLLEEIENILNAELTYKPWRALCKKVLHDPEIRAALLIAPGAKSIHHAFSGGLLEHTLGVMRVCMALCDLYPQADREILAVAALFHDLGKTRELSTGLAREYTDAGRLLGHIEIGLEMLEPFLRQVKDLPPELMLHLRHLILSHHGELEFGSPRRPKTTEAFILHYADNLDAKINTVNEALEDEASGGWSEYQRVLNRYLYQPARTPRAEKPEKPEKNAKASAKVATLPFLPGLIERN